MAAATLLAGTGGCLFDTRAPIPPTTVGQCPLVVLSAPDSVWNGLIQAFACRDSAGSPTGGGNYEAIIAEDFVFRPDPADSAEFVSIDPSNAQFIVNWTHSVEVAVFNSLAAGTDSMSLGFTNRGQTGLDLQADYVLTTYNHDDSLRVIIATYQGQVRLSLNSGSYRIRSWDDIREAGDSWGRLKLAIRQRGT